MIAQVEGDVFAVLRRLPTAWAHGIVTDPPYGWDFMGREFDRQHRRAALDEQALYAGWLTDSERRARGVRPMTDGERYALWSLGWLREAYRVLVPGGILLGFQGAKSYDAFAFAGRLAGFEVLPMIAGITGQAMAQGGDLGKMVDREAGAVRETTWRPYGVAGGVHQHYEDRPWLQRAQRDGGKWHETGPPATPLARDFNGHGTRIRDQLMPIAVLMKPTEGSFASNARRWGVAGFDVDGARIETEDRLLRPVGSLGGTMTMSGGSVVPGRITGSTSGRYPGNVLVDEAAAEEVGEMSGWCHPAGSYRHGSASGRVLAARDDEGAEAQRPWGDRGGTAARYFRRFRYIARAPKSERMRGLETWHWVGDPEHPEGWRRVGVAEWQTIPKRRQMVGSNHPTVKALGLTRWAARLILPPPGPEATAIRERTTGSRSRVLVPFSGVASEAIGCALAGWADVVAIEMSESYVAQAACRWRAWGPYSEARAVAIEEAGSVASAGHEGQGKLFEVEPRTPSSGA